MDACTNDENESPIATSDNAMVMLYITDFAAVSFDDLVDCIPLIDSSMDVIISMGVVVDDNIYAAVENTKVATMSFFKEFFRVSW